MLRDPAVELGAEHRFAAEMVSFEEHDDHVRAVLSSRDDGEESVVTADHLVAADGAHSKLRDQLGIRMGGRGSFADCVTISFKGRREATAR